MLLQLRLDEAVTPSIGPTAPLSPPLPAVVFGPEVEDEVLLAGADVKVVGFDCEAVLDNVGRTVVGITEDFVVEVEDGVLEELVLDEVEAEVVEELGLELAVVLDGEVRAVSAEVDEGAEVVEIVEGFPLDTVELCCEGEFELDAVVAELEP